MQRHLINNKPIYAGDPKPKPERVYFKNRVNNGSILSGIDKPINSYWSGFRDGVLMGIVVTCVIVIIYLLLK